MKAKSEGKYSLTLFSFRISVYKVHVPGATESATVRNDFLCNLCSSSLQEKTENLEYLVVKCIYVL